MERSEIQGTHMALGPRYRFVNSNVNCSTSLGAPLGFSGSLASRISMCLNCIRRIDAGREPAGAHSKR